MGPEKDASIYFGRTLEKARRKGQIIALIACNWLQFRYSLIKTT